LPINHASAEETGNSGQESGHLLMVTSCHPLFISLVRNPLKYGECASFKIYTTRNWIMDGLKILQIPSGA
jgi:hypothetical protein